MRIPSNRAPRPHASVRGGKRRKPFRSKQMGGDRMAQTRLEKALEHFKVGRARGHPRDAMVQGPRHHAAQHQAGKGARRPDGHDAGRALCHRPQRRAIDRKASNGRRHACLFQTLLRRLAGGEITAKGQGGEAPLRDGRLLLRGDRARRGGAAGGGPKDVRHPESQHRKLPQERVERLSKSQKPNQKRPRKRFKTDTKNGIENDTKNGCGFEGVTGGFTCGNAKSGS